MQFNSEFSSPWMSDLHKQSIRSKHILLYGNLSDIFLFTAADTEKERYVTLRQFTEEYFVASGCDLVAWFDPVDGVRLANPSTMRPVFDRLIVESFANPVITAGPTLDSPSPSGSAVATSSQSTPLPNPEDLTDPEQAIDVVRRLLRQQQYGVVFILDFFDKLTGDPDHHTDKERRVLIQLKKAISEAAYIPGDRTTTRFRGRRNSLVILGSQLGRIPPWIYRDNPLISLVQVNRPGLEDRKSFARQVIGKCHEGNALESEEANRIASEIADLTDGLTAWDLDAIRRTSFFEKMSVRDPKILIDYYKYGKRDDPWEQLDLNKISTAQGDLERRVLGQPHAVTAVVDMLSSAKIGISMSQATSKSGKPKGVFFFVGPTGVGKTELAKALTALIFRDESAFARFDMSEYAQEHASEKLTGSPPGFVGYEQGGQLTNRVLSQPFGVLLFDEIEKAHPRIMDKFLQILEDGRLTDGKGQTAYFSQSVIIFTSNIGSDSLAGRLTGADLPKYEEVRDHYLQAVRQHFMHTLKRPEILNRLGENVVVFDMLRPQHVMGICNKFLSALVTSAKDKAGLNLSFGPELNDMIEKVMASSDNLLFGGRRIKMLLEDLVERPINRWVLLNQPVRGAKLRVVPDERAGDIHIHIE